MKLRGNLRGLIGIAIFVLATNDIFATTLVRMSIAQMTQNAGLVVEGTVEGQQSRWDESGRYIITEITVKVNKSLKGRPGNFVTVRVLGGEVGDVGMYVAGAARFTDGEEVLLLLEKHPIRDWRVVGLHQGKFDITTDPKTGRKSARGPTHPVSAPLEDLEGQIRAAIEGSQP